MSRPVRRSANPSPPSVVQRFFVVAAALSLTSCPHQGDAVRLLVRAALHRRNTAAARTVRMLVQETASNAGHLTGPQIVAPPYAAAQHSALEETDTPDYVETQRASVEAASTQLATTTDALSSETRPLAGHAPELRAASAERESELHAASAERESELHAASAEHEPPATEEPLIYSIGRETQIFAEPRFDARRVGYLRYGSEVRRTTAAVSQRNCVGGWFGVQPMGYICANGRAATTDPHHPFVLARIQRPDRMASLPYAYAVARRGVPHLYGFSPVGTERPAPFASKRLLAAFGQLPNTVMADWWRRPHEVFGYPRPKDVASLGDGLVGGGVAVLGFYTDAGTLYGVTPDLELVTTDALEPVRPSTFAGKSLDAVQSLPVAFAMAASTWLYTGDPRQGSLRTVRQLARREAVNLGNERLRFQGQEWLSTSDGSWLRSSGMRIVEARTDWPEWVQDTSIWVDVSIQQQTLVAYEGKQPAFVTLVSTGVDGLLDPATTKSTKTGVFHVISKHLTATMNGDSPDNTYEMREVPWVQYFSEGYALHGAYWHDGFGQPRSHGCVNMSPLDARWLFHFTNPGLPKNWHGAVPLEPSATVYVHP